MDCPSCGKSNPAENIRCEKCDSPLSDAELATRTMDAGWSAAIPGMGEQGDADSIQVLHPGSVLGERYEILEMLGKGGMGAVYKARDRELGRVVALKLIRPELAGHAEIMRRFKQEILLASKITHKNVIRIFDLGQADGIKFITMEYVEGKDLKTLLHTEPRFSVERITGIIKQVCRALDAAHSEAVVHRDLKPSNIMLDSHDKVTVMDFGIARSTEVSGMTRTGAVIGTPEYMSPEQALSGKVDARSDLFSLGLIFYEMLTGKNPFEADTAISTLVRRTQERATPPAELDHSIPQTLNEIVVKCLAKDPALRYQSAQEMLNDLEAGHEIHRVEVATAPARRPRGPALPLGRWPTVAGLATLIIVLVVGAWYWNRRPPRISLRPESKSISVIIADTQNQTGDSMFDGVLERLLSISLNGTSYITVYDSKAARDQAAQLKPGSDGRVDVELAQLISRRQGIDAVISSSIEKSGAGYLIKVAGWDPAKTVKIGEIDQAIKAKGDVLKVADVLSAKLRDELGIIPSESTEALIKETFTTDSLEAMHAYAKGQEADDLGKPDEAIQWLRKALDADPNFGRAYAILAVVYYNQGQYKEARGYFQEAIKRIDQMTDREKYRTRGIYYLMVRDFKKAIEEYGVLLKQYPGDYAAHANLALANYFARNMPQALEEGRRDISYNPQSVNGHYNLSWYALAAGDLKTAEAETRKALALRPDFAEAHVTLALSQLVEGRLTQAGEAYEKLGALGSFGASVAATGKADLALYEGRMNDAARILEQGMSFDLKNKRPYDAADKSVMLAQVLFAKGQKNASLQALERALKTDNNNEVVFSAAQLYIDAGQVEKARALAGELSKKIEAEPIVYAKLIGGLINMARGDVTGAIKLMQEGQELLDTWLGRLLLGRAYLEAGAYTQAYSEFELCLKRQGEAVSVFLNDLPTYRYFPQVYYYLGRAQQGLGSAKAAESFRQFLIIKENGDRTDPMILDAQARLSTK